MKRLRPKTTALVVALAVVAGGSSGVRAQSVLHVSPNADLKLLDPMATTATTTLMHGLLIYDTLYAPDENLHPHPQMVGTEQVSADKLTYTFTLRPGLRFQDGSPVSSRDVIASLKRWMVRDVVGQALASFTDTLQAVDASTFSIKLKRPFPVEFALASSGSALPVIMREKEANTDPFKNVTETIGSGPFRFVRSEWLAGAKVVYEKNPDYVPRNEPANGLAGGKVAKVDRVEFDILPDATTKAGALEKGEIDLIDQLPFDLAGPLSKNPDVTVGPIPKVGGYAFLRPNSLYPPFNNPKARQALAMAVNQADYMMAATGDKRWWQACFSYFVCGSPNGTEVGSDNYHHPDLARAKQLLAESGYKGETVVMLSSHELDYIGALNDVAVANLKALGLNLDVVETDWGTLVSRRANKNPPERGGWNLFITSLSGSALFSPLSNPVTDESCDQKNWFGWPCDEQAEQLRTKYIEATDPEKQKAALEALHARLWQDIPTVLIGQYTQLYAWRKNLVGLPRSPSAVLAFWNVEKK